MISILPSGRAIRLALALAALMLLGSMLLMLPGMSTRGLSWGDAIFTSASALTVTGLSRIQPGVDLTLAGQIALMLLIQVGGIGYMVFAVTLFRILGRQVSLADRLALQDSLGVISLDGLVRLAKSIFVIVLTIEFAGAVALAIAWRDSIPPDTLAFYALFHAVSAFCNAGFDLFGGNPQFPDGLPLAPGVLGVKSALIFLGSIGIPVVYDLVQRVRFQKRLTLHTRLTLATASFLIVLGTLALFASEQRGVLAGLPFWEQAKTAFFQSVASRSAGFAGLPDFGNLSGASQLTLIWLMFIGGSPASMGGGITTGTFLILTLAALALVRGEQTPRIAGRAIPGETVRKAASVLTVAIFAVILASWIILATHETTLDMAVFEVVSAFATCGLSLGLTTELNPIGQAVIILMMFWGRLGALTILYIFSTTSRHSRVGLPEEKILIG